MRGRDRQRDARLHFLAQHERGEQVRPTHAAHLGERQQRGRDGRSRMDHGAHMRIAEVEHVRAGGIEKRSAQHVDALTAADHRRLPAAGKLGQ